MYHTTKECTIGMSDDHWWRSDEEGGGGGDETAHVRRGAAVAHGITRHCARL